MSNAKFIFAGSEFHIMQGMFLSAARPFYNSADILELKAIDLDVYSEFILKHMTRNRRAVDEGVITKVYNLFEGNTYAVQKTFNEVFTLLSERDSCSLDIAVQAIENVIESKAPLFEEMLSNISERYKPLLYSIAQEGKVKQITSASFIKKYRLLSSSSVQHSAKHLLEKSVITRLGGIYSVTDVFFRLWINSKYGKIQLRDLIAEN